MRKIHIFLFLFIGILSVPVFAGDEDLGKMENTLANGYLEAGKNNIPSALGYFTESVALAEKAQSWKGFIDAGNAFMVLGKPREALEAFKKASDTARTLKDWRGLLAVSYSYINLPDELNGKKSAILALKDASAIAGSDKDWRGLAGAGKAFSRFAENKEAEKCLNQAKEIVRSLGSGKAAAALGKTAKECGFMDIYEECAAMSKDFKRSEREYAAAPPEDWKPYGESVAGPREISVEAQQAMRASADNDIKSKREYLASIEKKEKEKSRYYGVFTGYYDYPYNHRYYSGYGYRPDLTVNEISGWATHRLSRYRRHNNAYIYIY